MSGIVLALAGRTAKIPGPTTIGQAFGGGFYAGQIGESGVATHYLIIGPRASAQASTRLKVKNVGTATAGTDSVVDGLTNTASMVADGDATVYPAAWYCKGVTAGGQTDWYLPARNELEVIYYNLKPATTTNTTGSGINPNAIPPRASNYTAGNPAQTPLTDFQDPGGAESMGDYYNYWASTAITDANNARQNFGYGLQQSVSKITVAYTRAVRRVVV